MPLQNYRHSSVAVAEQLMVGTVQAVDTEVLW